MKDLKEWLSDNFVNSQEYKQFRRNVIDRLRRHDDKISEIKQRLDNKNIQTDIDIEMFGVKLIKARLINSTKSLLFTIILICLCLYFIFRWL